ncbi:MAG: 4-hydroxy-tetrahydrodipicolinate synthase [bacterium]|nr:4-hydroxy-tetrahydrodipicolinate synthase [bacterium]
MKFSGSIVPIVTPFKEGKVDYATLEELIEFHIKEGTNGFVPCGTTGESATLSHEEHKEVVDFVVRRVAGRVLVVAGAGSNSTVEALELAKYAESVGADAVLSITPYYNKPTQEGVCAHFSYIAQRLSIPVILYNVPSRTGVNMSPATLARLAEVENIVGVKEASGDIHQVSEIIRLCGEDFSLICGEDANLLPILSVGGVGAIAATANVAPADIATLIKEFQAGHIEEARKLHYKLLPLCDAMFSETNPSPAKEALNMMGLLPSPELRLPLVPLKKDSRDKLRSVLTEYGLL